jgi:hypothetical protein
MVKQPLPTPAGVLRIGRESHLFASQVQLMKEFKTNHDRIVLAPDQLVHPPVPADYIVRRGQLRVSQFLPNGQEVTRAVLQAGSFLITRPLETDMPKQTPNDAADIYNLADIVLMSLVEAVLWVVPAGSLDQID